MEHPIFINMYCTLHKGDLVTFIQYLTHDP